MQVTHYCKVVQLWHILVVASTVGVDTQLVSYDTSWLWLPLQSSHSYS